MSSAAPDSEFHSPNAERVDQYDTEGMPHDHPLSAALFRVMKNVIFQDVPNPELDCLPLAQLRMLWTVFHHGAAPMKDFSEKLGVSQSTATQLADRLVRRGMVERLADQNDRRMVILRTTEAAQCLLRESSNCKQLLLSEIWSRLTISEQDQVLLGLQILGFEAEKLNPNPRKGVFPDSVEKDTGLNFQTPGTDLAKSRPVVDIVSRSLALRQK